MPICLSSQFWSDFFPNLSATFIGLILGLPLALWTNRIISKGQFNKEENEKQKRLINALEIINKTVTDNLPKIQKFTTSLKANKVPLHLPIDITVWEALKDDVLLYLHDPELKKDMANHFLMLNKLVHLSSIHLDYSAGIGAAIGGIENTRDHLRKYLITYSLSIQLDCIRISALIKIRTKKKKEGSKNAETTN